MSMTLKTKLTALTALAAFSMTPGAFAADDRWSLDNLWSKPIVRQAAIGTAAGVAAGALSDRTSVTKGALTGAVVGVGTGALSQSRYLDDKPLVRNALQGAVIGTGASYATGASKTKGAVLGTGAGAGYHYIRKMLDK